MISLKLAGTFGDDAIFVSEFLRAGRRWAPTFCDNWENQLEAAEKSVDFFKTTRAYRLAVIRENPPSRTTATANAATLQGVTQEQSAKGESFNQDGQKSKEHNHNHSTKRGDGKCICGEEHSFKRCPYIVSSNRKKGWKEDKKIRDEMREQIRNRPMIHRAISKMTNTNILNEFPDPWIKKSEGEDTPPADLKASSSFRFGNMTLSSQNEIHPLYKSVIYDSECSDLLTYDRDRFVDDLRPANEWIKTPNELMNVAGYGTMIVNGKLSNKTVRLKFANTT
jgi:hypothetical protein